MLVNFYSTTGSYSGIREYYTLTLTKMDMDMDMDMDMTYFR